MMVLLLFVKGIFFEMFRYKKDCSQCWGEFPPGETVRYHVPDLHSLVAHRSRTMSTILAS